MVAYPTAVSITPGNPLIDVAGPVTRPRRRDASARTQENAFLRDNECMRTTVAGRDDQSPSADYRLRKHADYQRVYREGRKQFSSSMSYFFALRAAGSPEPAGPRVGLTAGKVLGKAVDRNRIKRRIRDIVRRRVELVHADVDIVLHPRKSVLTMEFTKLESEVVRIFTMIDSAIEKANAVKSLPGKPIDAKVVEP
jgi:ribonuclease P protein component